MARDNSPKIRQRAQLERKKSQRASYDRILIVSEGRKTEAIASIPCFELWLLLHYEDVQHPIHRNAVLSRLKLHIRGYDKGNGGSFTATKGKLDIASQRARQLAARSTAYDDAEPSTDIVDLVTLLIQFGK